MRGVLDHVLVSGQEAVWCGAVVVRQLHGCEDHGPCSIGVKQLMDLGEVAEQLLVVKLGGCASI